MKSLTLILSSLFLSFSVFASGGGTDRNVAEYNLGPNDLAVQGYDPVGYFTEGGSRAIKGTIELNYKDVVYNFESRTNLDAFINEPEKYEPTYGGWCAMAMVQGQKVDIDPSIYHVDGDRLHFFVSENAKNAWLQDEKRNTRRADRNWFKISGEGPRGQ